MKTPKKKEVVKHFENAKEVESLAGTIFEFNPNKKIVERSGVFRYEPKGTSLILWNPTQGYAKILSYKEPKEKTYKITREQILKYNMKDEFPEVFETKLTVGKWYKTDDCWLFCYQKEDNVFGFNPNGWNYVKSWEWNDTNVTEATNQEVEEALIKEAVRIGFKEGVYFNGVDIGNNDPRRLGCVFKSFDCLSHIGLQVITPEETWHTNNSNPTIFYNGQWATIIPTLTIQEAEAKLNCKIV